MGVAFDGVNAIWYLLAGDLVNAGFSAMAFLPIIGDAAGAGKLLQNAASKIGSQASELFAKYGDNVVKCVDDILGFAKKKDWNWLCQMEEVLNSGEIPQGIRFNLPQRIIQIFQVQFPPYGRQQQIKIICGIKEN